MSNCGENVVTVGGVVHYHFDNFQLEKSVLDLLGCTISWKTMESTVVNSFCSPFLTTLITIESKTLCCQFLVHPSKKTLFICLCFSDS